MTEQQTPITWQPISVLPQLAWVLDGMAESAAEQLGNLRVVQTRPGSLDNATRDRVITSYTQQRDDLWLYDEQLTRWQAKPRSAAQQAEVVRLTALLGQLRADIATLLALADQCNAQTIESILGMSDMALGLAVLSGKRTPPSAPAPPPHGKTPRGKKKEVDARCSATRLARSHHACPSAQ